MSHGYVYILTNPSFPNMIKIGRTYRDCRARARELSSTGVPTPFQLAFEIFSAEHETLETQLHNELHDFRVSSNREFFYYPLAKAIKLALSLSDTRDNQDHTFAANDILLSLKTKYPHFIRPEIIAIRIIQSEERVWLETTVENEIAGYLVNQIIMRSDLAFISNGENNCFFNPSDTVTRNADKFVNEFDAYSIINTTDLFTSEACTLISNNYNNIL